MWPRLIADIYPISDLQDGIPETSLVLHCPDPRAEPLQSGRDCKTAGVLHHRDTLITSSLG